MRGNNRRRLFSFRQDYLFYLRQLGRGLDKHFCEVHALTMMANHVHLLVTPATVERLANLMKYVAQTYAQYRNRRRDGSGKLFEERYRAERVIGADGMRAVTVYIDANAVKAGLVEDPLDYPWSTYAILAGQPARSRIPAHLVTLSPWYLSLGPSAAHRARAYGDIFRRDQGAEQGSLPLKADCERLEGHSAPYTRRLERPNRTRATDRKVTYGVRALVDPTQRDPGRR